MPVLLSELVLGLVQWYLLLTAGLEQSLEGIGLVWRLAAYPSIEATDV